MINASRIALILLAIVAMASFFPVLYWKTFDTQMNRPYVSYSVTQKAFLVRRHVDKKNHYYDAKGKELNLKEFEQRLPMFHSRQLTVDGLMPDSLFGVEMDMHYLMDFSGYYRIKPTQMSKPDFGLYPLLESESGRVNLEMPDDYFRIGKRGMEFIDAESNAVLNNKSTLFTEALKQQGFHFPAQQIAGLPTIRKSRDEGYFVVDDAHHLFHLKMIKGEPMVSIVPIMRDLRIKHIECLDVKNREFYCFVVSEDNDVFVIISDSYEFKKLPLNGYLSDEDDLRMTTNIFNKQVTINGDGFTSVFVMDRDYHLIDQFAETWKSRENTSVGLAAQCLFPFTISNKDKKSKFRHFRIVFSGLKFVLLFNVLWGIIYLIIMRMRNTKLYLLNLLVVLVTGIYGFISILIIPSEIDG